MNSRHLIPCLVLALAAFSYPAFAQVSISLDIAPPPLVVEEQPECPDDGYIWTPGYWAYDEDQGAYYWVAGTWVQPPEVGLYWTPNYWGWENNVYVYHAGYWGPTVGFYGGVNYGHGYWGDGYRGGRWDNGHFAYNREANRVAGPKFHNVYEDKAGFRAQSNRVSFNGGKGGIQAQPTPEQRAAEQQNHIQPTAQQQSHFQTAQQTRSHEVKVNAHNKAAAGGQQPQGQAQPNVNANANVQHNNGEQPAAAPTPAANQQGEKKVTGENAQAERHDAAKHHNQPEQKVAPMNNQPATENTLKPSTTPEVKQEHPVQNQIRPEVKQQEAQVPHQQAQPEVKHQSEVQHPAETHPQGPAGGQQHPQGPQGQPHPQPQGGQQHQEAKPQGGGGNGGGQKDDKH